MNAQMKTVILWLKLNKSIFEREVKFLLCGYFIIGITIVIGKVIELPILLVLTSVLVGCMIIIYGVLQKKKWNLFIPFNYGF